LPEVQPLEKLHRVVEGAVLGDPVVEELDGVRGLELGGCLRFPLEPPQQGLDVGGAGDAERVGSNELDCHPAIEHLVAGDAPAAEQVHQLVVPEHLRRRHRVPHRSVRP